MFLTATSDDEAKRKRVFWITTFAVIWGVISSIIWGGFLVTQNVNQYVNAGGTGTYEWSYFVFTAGWICFSAGGYCAGF